MALLSNCRSFIYKKLIPVINILQLAFFFWVLCNCNWSLHYVLHSLIETWASYSLKRTILYIYIYILLIWSSKKKYIYIIKCWHIWKNDRPCEKLMKAPYFYHKQSMYKLHYFSNLGSHSIASGGTPVFPSFPKMCPTLSASFHCWLWQNAPYSIHPFPPKNIPS